MPPNRDIEWIKFSCKKNHHWSGTFVPNTPPDVGTLVGSWKCPICNDLGKIDFIECPDTKNPEIKYLVPLDKDILRNEHLPVKGLLDLSRQIISNILRYKFGAISIERIHDLYAEDKYFNMSPYDKISLTETWQLQDIIDLLEEELNK